MHIGGAHIFSTARSAQLIDELPGQPRLPDAQQPEGPYPEQCEDLGPAARRAARPRPAPVQAAARGAAGRAVRRRRVPGRAGHLRRVLPAERGHPDEGGRGLRRAAAAVHRRRAVRRGVPGPLAAAADAALGEPGARRARAGRGGLRGGGLDRVPVLPRGAGRLLGEPLHPRRALRRAAAHGQAGRAARHRQRRLPHPRHPGHHARGRGERRRARGGRPRLGLGQRRPGVHGGPLRAQRAGRAHHPEGPARPGGARRRRLGAAPSAASRAGWSAAPGT